jgi:asparagine synthase (glutamine-hydrolysing)
MNRELLYSEDLKRKLADKVALSERFQKYAERVSTGEDLDVLLYLDSKTYLPGDILTKVDRMSMATSLETRAPLLDQKLIDFVTRIPAALKIVGKETKHIFKQAIRDLIPEEVMTRPKQGFGIPMSTWINQELRAKIRETLGDSLTRQRGYFDYSYVELLLKEHERGRRDHSKALWALLMLELWHRRFLDSKPVHLQVDSGAVVCST